MRIPYEQGRLDVFIAMNLYRCYRVWLRIRMGKDERNKFLEDTHINIGDFLLAERPIKVKNGIMAIPRRHTQDFHILFRKNEKEIEPEILDIASGETFIDVGANVGYYTLKAAAKNFERERLASDDGSKNDLGPKVISIEPHPDNYKALVRNISCNGYTNIVTVNKAVWDSPGQLHLRQRINGKSGKRVMTDDPSLCFEQDSNDDDGSYLKLQVRTDTIDNIVRENDVDKIGVLKIDVEGAELQALRGAKATAERTRKIVVEVHSESNVERVKSILNDFGFSTRRVTVVRTYEYPFVVGERPKDNQYLR
jgi:FkbM family methyltransferase